MHLAAGHCKPQKPLHKLKFMYVLSPYLESIYLLHMNNQDVRKISNHFWSYFSFDGLSLNFDCNIRLILRSKYAQEPSPYSSAFPYHRCSLCLLCLSIHSCRLDRARKEVSNSFLCFFLDSTLPLI